VINCFDYKLQKNIALKIIKNDKRFNKQALVEVMIKKIRILDALKSGINGSCNYIIEMLDYFKFRNHTCISFELLHLNLYDYMRNKNIQVI